MSGSRKDFVTFVGASALGPTSTRPAARTGGRSAAAAHTARDESDAGDRRQPGRRRRAARLARRLRSPRWLVLHAGVYVVVNGFFVVTWLLAPVVPGVQEQFWPAWIMLLLGVPLGLHAAVVLATRPSGRAAERPRPQAASATGTSGPGGQQPARAERTLATVLLTDIVGSTQQARQVGDRRWGELLDAHDRLARELVDRFGGRLIKSTGDGVLAVFDRPGRGIRCATTLRDRLRGIGIDIRAGLHTGEVQFRDADVGGIAVHIAARGNGGRRRRGGPGVQDPLHGLLPDEAAEVVALFHQWGETDRSHRKLAHRGSYLERVWVSPSSVRRVLAAEGLRLRPLPRPGRWVRKPFPGWVAYRPNSIWIYDTTHFTHARVAATVTGDLVSRKWIAEIVSAEETSTQVQVVFCEALEREGLAELVAARQDGRVDLARDDPSRPVLLAMSDNGPQMTSGSTREFLALCAIHQHFGRPGTPTDQAWVESLFGHVKAEWPHLLTIGDPAVLRAELALVRERYNGVRLSPGRPMVLRDVAQWRGRIELATHPRACGARGG